MTRAALHPLVLMPSTHTSIIQSMCVTCVRVWCCCCCLSVAQVPVYGFRSERSIVDGGVLCSSPFGKGVRVRFINMTTGDTLATALSNFQEDDETADDYNINADLAIERNPTHVVLRVLFLDDDEVPDR
jgi:hypothetical protein